MVDGSGRPLQTVSASRGNHKANDEPAHPRDQSESLPRRSDNPKARSPPPISPPPTKRARIGSGGGALPRSRPRLPLAKHAASFLAPSDASNRQRGSDEFSLSSSATSHKSNANVHTCRTCQKKITKGFDPLVRCPACQRPYHESCRKPLSGTADRPDLEKCFRCAPDQRRSQMNVQDSSLSDVSHSAADNYRDRPSNLPLKTTPAINTSNEKSPPPHAPLRTVSHLKAQTRVHRAFGVQSRHANPKSVSHKISKDGASGSMSFLDELQDNILDKLTVERTTPQTKDKSPLPLERSFALKGRTEIPETPDQIPYFSQVPTTAATSKSLQAVFAISPSSRDGNDIIPKFAQPIANPGRINPYTHLCCVCQEKSVRYLGSKGGKRIMCNDCKAKKRTSGSHEVDMTIPETPDPMQQHLSSTVPPPQSTIPSTSRSTSEELAKLAGTNLFLMVKNVPKIRKKFMSADVSSASMERNEEEPQLNDQECKSRSLPRNYSPQSETPAITENSTVDKYVPSQFDVTETPSKTPAVDRLSGGDAFAQVGNTSDISLPDEEHISELGHASESNGLLSTTTCPSDYTLSLDMSALHSPLDDVSDPSPQESESYRQGPYAKGALVGMALLAANGVPWTTAQVHDWIADKFPEYRKGEGGWEKSTSVMLSKKAEFHGARVAGQTAFLWTWRSAADRNVYEKDYGKHPVFTDKSLQPKVESLPRRAFEEPKSATYTSPKVVIQANRPDRVFTTKTVLEDLRPHTQHFDSAVIEKVTGTVEQHAHGEIRGVPMPFERPEDYPALQGSVSDPNIRRETDFFRAFPQYAKSSIETWTKEEIQNKIEEIKKRPSRKAGFGDHLRIGRSRQDPHDETDGAWRPTIPKRNREKLDAKGKGTSLKEIFGLPENPIPIIYEGQLAFRDGTLVNGRLPRARGAVYKVGRLLGGGLRL